MSWRDVLDGSTRHVVITGDCREVLAKMPDKSVAHVITDPPYSEHVHSKSRAGSRALHGGPGSERSPANFSRSVDFGFDSLSLNLRHDCARHFGRLASRWVLVFSDAEGVDGWRRDLTDVGLAGAFALEHVRVGAWIKVGCTPQFTGDRPATGFEAIEIAHPPGRKRWNGGGRHAIWSVPIVLNRGGDAEPRVHATQKPLELMLALVEQFTDEGDIVLDPFCGSGTTGVACIRLGRRFIGIELNPAYADVARERLAAESEGSTLTARRQGQAALFGADAR